MALTFEGRLAKEDVRRGFALHCQASGVGGRGTRLALQVALLLLCISGLLWVVTGAVPGLEGVGWLFALGLVVVALTSTAPWWGPAALARSTWRAGGGVADLRTGTADEGGLHTVTAHVDSRQNWQAFVMYRRGSDMLVLYPSRRILQMYTRGLFASDADWQAFGNLVADHVPEAAQVTRPSAVALWALRIVAALLLAAGILWLFLVLTRIRA